MRAFDKLGVRNHTAEFATSVEISSLDEEASSDLVRLPMIKSFGYDVYHTELGKRAVEYLLDLSGCHPTYLMRLCNKMFQYYTDSDKCPRNQIYVRDVEDMEKGFVSELNASDLIAQSPQIEVVVEN